MIPKAKSLKLVAIYLYICELHEKELKHLTQRYSNNSKPDFTDQEIITVYLYVVQQERRFQINQIYQYADQHLRSWFPSMPSYTAFNSRLNRLSEAFKAITANMMSSFKPQDCTVNFSLLDSMPIITCSGKRKAKVAQELADKGYNATKSLYYHGIKLHMLAFSRPRKMPFPEQVVISSASESDLNIFKQCWSNIPNRTFFGDKIYHSTEFFADLKNQMNSVMYTPVKAVQHQCQTIKNIDHAANQLYSVAVSRIRQPIESLFNWLIEKTDFQRASKVRATKGLLVHIFGKMAAAFIYLIFNS